MKKLLLTDTKCELGPTNELTKFVDSLLYDKGDSTSYMHSRGKETGVGGHYYYFAYRGITIGTIYVDKNDIITEIWFKEYLPNGRWTFIAPVKIIKTKTKHFIGMKVVWGNENKEENTNE